MKINRDELMDALETLFPGLGKTDDHANDQNVFIFHDNFVYSENDYITMKYPLKHSLECAVMGSKLYALLAQTKEPSLEITVTDNKFIVKTKRGKAWIALQSEYTVPVAFPKQKWVVLPEGFIEAISFAVFSASNDVTKPELCCVHVHEKHVESSDNRRITRVVLKKPVVSDVSIPIKAVQVLTKYKPTYIFLHDNCLYFKNEKNAEFYCRTVADDFPNVTPFLKTEDAYKIEFPKEMIEVLNKASIFLNNNVLNTALKCVTIAFSKDAVTVSTQDVTGGIEETLPCTCDIDGIKILINPDFVKQILKFTSSAFLNKDADIVKFKHNNFIHCCSVVKES